jgi:ABC-type Fe3+/spermidine/putrescine transport system ATPase subunit
MVLDEPMSNLDAKLRRQMQLELREILKAVGTTTLYVTHDQEEALAMSDRMVVMYGGRVEQAGTPSEVYHSPRTRFVAGFVGESNFVVGKVIKCTGERAEVQITPNWKVSANTHGERIAVGDEITLVVRPEDIQLQTKPVSGIPGVVSAMAFGGASLRLRIDVEGIPPLACEESSSLENELKIGSQVEIIIDDDAWISMPDRDAQ